MKISADHRVKVVQYDDPIVKIELSANEAVALLEALQQIDRMYIEPEEMITLRDHLTHVLNRYNIQRN